MKVGTKNLIVGSALAVIALMTLWSYFSLSNNNQGAVEDTEYTEHSSMSSVSASSGNLYGNYPCKAEWTDFQHVLSENRECTSDADCFMFNSKVTCWDALAKRGETRASQAAQNYRDCMKQSGAPLAAPDCLEQPVVSCTDGMCM